MMFFSWTCITPLVLFLFSIALMTTPLCDNQSFYLAWRKTVDRKCDSRFFSLSFLKGKLWSAILLNLNQRFTCIIARR